MKNIDFIPCTREIQIAEDVLYRPIKSWTCAVYAGEGLYKIPGTQDGSGCLIERYTCMAPINCTGRLYWSKKDPNKKIIAFLSYPNKTAICDSYHWHFLGFNIDMEHQETYLCEEKMESRIIELLNKDVSVNLEEKITG